MKGVGFYFQSKPSDYARPALKIIMRGLWTINIGYYKDIVKCEIIPSDFIFYKKKSQTNIENKIVFLGHSSFMSENNDFT